MIKLGITGGIGSGKSTISEIVIICGVPVYNADTESKKLLNVSASIRQGLTQLFGEELYQSGNLNRPLLASLIFTNKENLKKVNNIIHPEVGLDFDRWLKQHKDRSIIALESAILFESGFNKLVDSIATVYAPIDVRTKRVTHRDNCSKEKVMERIASQMCDEQKIERSDFVITNDDTQSIISQTFDMLNNLIVK